MSLSDLAALGSFVSSFAVVVSLIYLALQVRQAERNQRAVLNQGYMNRVADNLRWLAESPIIELRNRVRSGDNEFTAEELLRLQTALRLVITSAQDAYLQHESGLIDTMTLDNAMQGLRIWLSQPVYRALWLEGASRIAPQFRTVIEAMVLKVPLTGPEDLVTQFKVDLAAVMA